jgi:phosphoadenosine phosphosulfate reductase
MLKEQTLDRGVVDKEAMAIARIREFEPAALQKDDRGYYVCDSGGKDSLVITHLTYQTGVKFDIHHNHTTADHPETVRYVRRMAQYWRDKGIDYHIEKPRYMGEPTSMWKLISEKGLPTRIRRWCCKVLKEGGGEGRAVITGVRRAESTNRRDKAIAETMASKKADKIIIKNNDNDNCRNMLELCPTYRKITVNPIVDWQDDDVWEYIRKYNLPYNPLYDQGYHRVGCIGCPIVKSAELLAQPEYYKLYLHAAQRYLDKHQYLLDKYGWKDAGDMMRWWLSDGSVNDTIKGQISMWEDER